MPESGLPVSGSQSEERQGEALERLSEEGTETPPALEMPLVSPAIATENIAPLADGDVELIQLASTSSQGGNETPALEMPLVNPAISGENATVLPGVDVTGTARAQVSTQGGSQIIQAKFTESKEDAISSAIAVSPGSEEGIAQAKFTESKEDAISSAIAVSPGSEEGIAQAKFTESKGDAISSAIAVSPGSEEGIAQAKFASDSIGDAISEAAVSSGSEEGIAQAKFADESKGDTISSAIAVSPGSEEGIADEDATVTQLASSYSEGGNENPALEMPLVNPAISGENATVLPGVDATVTQLASSYSEGGNENPALEMLLVNPAISGENATVLPGVDVTGTSARAQVSSQSDSGIAQAKLSSQSKGDAISEAIAVSSESPSEIARAKLTSDSIGDAISEAAVSPGSEEGIAQAKFADDSKGDTGTAKLTDDSKGTLAANPGAVLPGAVLRLSGVESGENQSEAGQVLSQEGYRQSQPLEMPLVSAAIAPENIAPLADEDATVTQLASSYSEGGNETPALEMPLVNPPAISGENATVLQGVDVTGTARAQVSSQSGSQIVQAKFADDSKGDAISSAIAVSSGSSSGIARVKLSDDSKGDAISSAIAVSSGSEEGIADEDATVTQLASSYSEGGNENPPLEMPLVNPAIFEENATVLQGVDVTGTARAQVSSQSGSQIVQAKFADDSKGDAISSAIAVSSEGSSGIAQAKFADDSKGNTGTEAIAVSSESPSEIA
ncbi:MAG: hypothetical protein F6J93_36845, partial [Oscillatoria sp. SIO1A7]|nr:hypothetical protein [Oscillatoria sp. SIO1A7]